MLNSIPASHLPYRPDIDGLRAIAVLSVVSFHAFPTGLLRGGFVGVDVFFVISGFLITSIILTGQLQERFTLSGFYVRRILRIFPALLVVLVFCLVFGWFSLFADEYRQLGKHVTGGAAFIANFVFWGEVGYFDTAAETKPLIHLWSLGIEEQFYIVWPLLLALIWKKTGNFIHVVATLGVLSFATNIFLSFTDPDAAFYSPFARIWELIAGGLLACLALNRPIGFGKYGNAASFLGLLLVVAAMIAIRKNHIFPGWPVLPVAGAALLIAVGPNTWLNRTVLASRPFVWFGLISYPLYLWHWPLLSFLRIPDGTALDIPVETRAAAVAVSIVLAWLTYVVIEKPIRFGRRKSMWVPVLVTTMIAVGGAGYAIFHKDGLPVRVDVQPPSASVLFSDYPHPLLNETCLKVYPQLADAWSCLLSKPQEAEVAIVGDSHAHQYFRSLAAYLPDRSVLNVSQPGCLPFSAAPGCRERAEKILSFLVDSSSIETVYLTGYFSVHASGLKYGNVEGRRVANALTTEDEEKFREAGRMVLSTLVAEKKDVIVLLDIPDLVFRPRDCVAFKNPVMRFLRSTGKTKPFEQCGIDATEYESRIAAHDAAIAALLAEFPSVRVYDPRPLFCDREQCHATKDGEFLYWNSDHLTMKGTDLVIEPMLKEVPPIRSDR